MHKPIIDVCCGSKMFWFDKNNPNVEFCDIREFDKKQLYKERMIEVKPDTVCDFTDLPFEDNSFKLVVFDPPHILKGGDTGWQIVKYGKLTENWEQVIHDGFSECMRVLDVYGTLIFKWSEIDITVSKIIEVIGYEPLFGHKSGKLNKTHWLAFMKFPEDKI